MKKWVNLNGKVQICHICTADLTLRYLLLNQLCSQRNRGFDVCAISSPGPEVPFIKAAGFRHLSVPMSRRPFSPVNDLVSLWRLWKIIRQERFTIVHTHTPKAGIYGRLAAKAAGVPIIIHTHHGFPFRSASILGRLFRVLEKIVASYSDLIFSVNREDMEFGVEKGIWLPSKVKLCGNGGIGINLDRFNPNSVDRARVMKKRIEIGLKDGAKVVGFAGRLVRDKGLLELFEAAQIVYKIIPNVCFLIIGPTDYAKRDAINPDVAPKYNISNFVYFLGLRHDMPEMYSLMDVFVLPSHREGFPLVLEEATAMGVPVIATNIAGCREAVEHGRNGLLVPLGNVPALADAIIEILIEHKKAQKMGEQGRRIAQRRFDERRVFENIEGEYAYLLKKRRIFLR